MLNKTDFNIKRNDLSFFEELLKTEPNENKIVIKGARTHNLKNIDVEMPRGKMIAITGPSGSGKSSLAFDTVFGLPRKTTGRNEDVLRPHENDARVVSQKSYRPKR